jgi:hypothetical protein
MFDAEDLREVECAFRFTYPASFRTAIGDVAALSVTAGFQAAFPRSRWLWTVPDIRAAQEDGLPACLIPFLRQEQPTPHTDYYAFWVTDRKPEYAVVLFALHTILADWSGFGAFVAWVRQRSRAYFA